MQNLETQFEELKSQVDALSNKAVENKLSMVVFSGELDKVLAGMAEHVDFVEQAGVGDGKRPDMIVRLPGNRFIAVDAKVTFNAYLDAINATTESARTAALQSISGPLDSIPA